MRDKIVADIKDYVTHRGRASYSVLGAYTAECALTALDKAGYIVLPKPTQGMSAQLMADADEIAGWGAGNEAGRVREAAARIAELETALRQSMTAIDDWLNDYAHDCCDADRVAEARKRIYGLGTIGYIAEVQAINRQALRSTP